jgi:hypothetical protein
MRAIPLTFVAGTFLVTLVAAIVVGGGIWAAPVVVALVGIGLLLVDRRVRDEGRQPADGVTDDLANRPPGA